MSLDHARAQVKAKYLIIAGPQAAGKTTLKQILCEQFPNSRPLEESRRIVVHKYQRKGAIFMTDLDEVEVIHNDMTRMFTILGQDRHDLIYVDETSVFTLGHARAHGIDLLAGYYKQYIDMLDRLDAFVIFLDVPPDVSWARRKLRYAERLWDLDAAARDSLMDQYKAYLERLHPELLTIYHNLPFQKTLIGNSGELASAARVMEDAVKAICSAV